MTRYLVIQTDDQLKSVCVWEHEGPAVCMSSIDTPQNFISSIPLVACKTVWREELAERIEAELLPFKGYAPKPSEAA